MVDILLGILIGVAVACALFFYLKNKKGDEDLTSRLESKLSEIFPKVLQSANEQLLLMAKEKLSSEKTEIKTDLENKRQAIEKMVDRVEKKLLEGDKATNSLTQTIEEQVKQTERLRATAEGLKNVLKNNQMRGQFGEQVADDLLKMVGFVRGVDFEFNKATGVGNQRPDFTIFLPDKTKVNVDVKFPYSNLQQASETDDEQAKRQLMKQFAIDVKEKIRQVTTRDYINPEDKTVDFVILFIPNEMIFSYIYEKLGDVWHDAMKNKVILAGPFSFTAILRMVRQAYDNFRYQENIQEIVGLIRQFEKQFESYNEEFSKLGNQIRVVSDTYQRVETTRTKQLTRVVDKIKSESEANPSSPPLIDKTDTLSI